MIKKYVVSCACLLAAGTGIKSQIVGIGMPDPSRGRLEIQNVGGTNTVAIFGANSQGISVQRNNPCIGFNQYFDGIGSRHMASGYAGRQLLNTTTGDLSFDLFANGAANASSSLSSNAINISRNGNIGIGTAPLTTARLTVARGTGFHGTAVFRGSSYASHINYSTPEDSYIRGGKAGGIVYLNDIPDGDVLLGYPNGGPNLVKVGINQAPFYTFEVRQANNRGIALVAADFHNWEMRVGPNTSPGAYQYLYYDEGINPLGAWHPQTGAYIALSDSRVKTDVQPLGQVSERVAALRPVQYKMDVPQGGDELQAGLIAQELMQVFPNLVTKQDDLVPGQVIPDMHLVNYDGLAVYAIKLIQEQQERIVQLKKRLETIKNNSQQPLLH